MHTQNSYVTSEPYSRVTGDRNWRHRVVDMDVFVRGPLHMLPRLQEVLKGNNIDVDGLTEGHVLFYCITVCVLILLLTVRTIRQARRTATCTRR